MKKKMRLSSEKSSKDVLSDLRNLLVLQEGCLLTSEALSLKILKINLQYKAGNYFFHGRTSFHFMPFGKAKDPPDIFKPISK